MTRCTYIDTDVAGGRLQTHCRLAGSGAPLIMLHPSPLSSAFLAPVMERAAKHLAVYAPDTPGYGQTAALPEPAESLVPYVDWLGGFMDGLGLERAALYGSATGAQIAIEMAKAHPGRVSALVLENAVHFTDEETDAIMAGYFPDISAQADGSHLHTAWTMADALFRGFPWYEHVASPCDPEPPVAVVHATALAYLQAGPDYARAYRAAFRNERGERLVQVPVPTRVIRWAGGLLREQADRLDDFDWPEHIRMVHCGAGLAARYQALEQVFEGLARP